MRKALFWTHLICGSAAAIVILVMSVTGVLLMYERQMIEWADRGYRSSTEGRRLAPEALLKNIAVQTGSMPDSLTLRADPGAPAEVSIGPRVVYADAASGQVLGDGSTGIRRFFRVVTDWHRWLALTGPERQIGRSVTGAANLVFFGLALTGMYLWLPRKWDWKNVRAVLLFRGGLSGKARDFNWHNVIGIWSAIPLIAVISGALVISYPWATNLVYRLAGSEPPAPSRPAQRAAMRVDLNGLDRAWSLAETSVPAWRSIAWRVSGGERISLSISESYQRGRVDLRSTLVVDRASGSVVQHEQFSDFSRGRQWRSWLRFIHTGEALGLAGQTVAGIVSAGAAVLLWTGLALTWRRFRSWRARRSPERAEVTAVSS